MNNLRTYSNSNYETRTLQKPLELAYNPARNYQQPPVRFEPLPSNAPPEERLDDTPWRIILVPEGGSPPHGYEIGGEVILGVGRDPSYGISLDLGIFGGWDKGVSRRHMALYVSRTGLHVTDLFSTNGTFVNKTQVRPGWVLPVKHQDVLTIGHLRLEVLIIKSPEDYPSPVLEE